MKLSRWLGVLSMMGEGSMPTKSLRALSGWAAVLGGVAAVINILAGQFTPELIPRAETVTWLTPSYVLAGFGWLVGLLLVGVDVRRARPFPSPWNQMPFSMVVAFVLLMGLFGVISSVLGNDRLAEVPVVIISLAGWRWEQ